MSNKLMPRLEKLQHYSDQIDSVTGRITQLRSNGDLTVKDFQAQLKTLMEEQQKVSQEFDQWLSTEFEFAEGQITIPKMLKTVLEKTIDAPRLITL